VVQLRAQNTQGWCEEFREVFHNLLDLCIRFSVLWAACYVCRVIVLDRESVFGMNMDIQQIVAIVLAGTLLGSGLLANSVLAHDGRLAKQESVPVSSMTAPKSDAHPAPHKLHDKSHEADGESKTFDKVKPSANGGASHHSSAEPSYPNEVTGKDGAPMVLVPAGEFTMGSDKGDEDEAPIHRVQLHTFYIDKYEVTNGRFARFVETIQSEPPWGFEDKDTPVTHADRPVRWVSWMDAMAYCLWVGKRLPTEAEWEKAARGTDGRIYPWGNDPPTPVHAVYGLKEGGEDALSVIGDRDKGQSPYGAYDLAGNLYEWVMDWYAEHYYMTLAATTVVNPRGPEEGTAKVQRGGAYINNPYRLRSSFRTKGDPTEQDPHVGFRCVQDVR